MNDETPEQRIKREIENNIKQTLRAITINREKSEELASDLQSLFKQQQCKHKWTNEGGFMYATVKCTECGYSFME